jgi:hypothetical protein
MQGPAHYPHSAPTDQAFSETGGTAKEADSATGSAKGAITLRPMSSRGHSFYFFFAPAEQVAVLESFEARHPRSYYCTDTASVPDVPAISSLVAESLGHLAIGDWIHSPDYLLTHPDEGIVVRESLYARAGTHMPLTNC